MEAARRIDERYVDRGASPMLLWAAWTVEGLDYLADIDAALPPSRHRHNHEAVDLAHARWATVDAATAIDLCAAALGRMHRGYPKGSFEMDFGVARKDAALLALDAPGVWIRGVDEADDYAQVRDLRDALVHRTASRRIELKIASSLGATGVGTSTRTSRARLHLSDPSEAIAVEELVLLCRDVARRHVSAFLTSLENL